ncbi:hypothetical protein [Streptomyces sp. NPDC056600]|uniref:hypothetical protein n=1 Tax=Streptomyces sp. NPDC056600 TaxID=3345874 RepID=UPI00369D0ACF
MDMLVTPAGRGVSPQEWAVVMLVGGAIMTSTGVILVLSPSVSADWQVQQQQDRYDAYGRGRPPTFDDREVQEVMTRVVGGEFAVVGPVLLIAGIVRLVTR